jgi:hypothetical protein
MYFHILTSNLTADQLLVALDGSYYSIPAVKQRRYAAEVLKPHQPVHDVSIGLIDCGDKPHTNVISISYYFYPDISDPFVSLVQRQCAEFGKVSTVLSVMKA